MDDAPFLLHLDSDYRWRWYVADTGGKLVPVSQPYFDLADAKQAMKAVAMPIAA